MGNVTSVWARDRRIELADILRRLTRNDARAVSMLTELLHSHINSTNENEQHLRYDKDSGTYITPNGLTLEGGSSPTAPAHTQSVASTTWVIAHNLNQRHVSIRVLDFSDNTLVPGIDYTSPNVVTLRFKNPKQGIAYITI